MLESTGEGQSEGGQREGGGSSPLTVHSSLPPAQEAQMGGGEGRDWGMESNSRRWMTAKDQTSLST